MGLDGPQPKPFANDLHAIPSPAMAPINPSAAAGWKPQRADVLVPPEGGAAANALCFDEGVVEILARRQRQSSFIGRSEELQDSIVDETLPLAAPVRPTSRMPPRVLSAPSSMVVRSMRAIDRLLIDYPVGLLG